jgi:hypothetical protein
MSDTPKQHPAKDPVAESLKESMTFAEFLETMPPTQEILVTDAINNRAKVWNINVFEYPQITPEIQLHCPDERCNGIRFFRCISPSMHLTRHAPTLQYLRYKCSNCQAQVKIFSLLITALDDEGSGACSCYKMGELPVYGPPTPARLISLIGPDRDVFLKGRRCENQGLGIGAFVYYRRVVENQKNRILESIIKVAEKLKAPPATIDVLKKAQAEQQFKKAFESVKDALPQVLLLDGHSPLTLLHSALSEGLHAQSDEECLELAHAVRVVLGELAERISQAMKDEAEVKSALTRLMTVKEKPLISSSK